MGACSSSSSKALLEGRFGTPLALTDEILKEFDKSQTGELNNQELQNFVKAAFPKANPTEEDIAVLMQGLDLDANGTVGVNELRAFLRCYDPSTHCISSKNALIIIDVQNDFISGTLANQYNAADIVPIINGLREKFDTVVISYDAHPFEHCSFVESVNAGKVPIKEELKEFAPFSQVTLAADADRPEHEQTLYPRHAAQGTDGFKTHPDLVVKETDGTILKGQKPNIDSYSAFFDNSKSNDGKRYDTGLTKLLEDKNITDVYCCGLVFDICVMSSALHGAEMGFKTHVIEDACRPLSQDNVPGVKDKLKQAGVEVLSSAEAEAELAKSQSRTLKDYVAYIKAHNQAKVIHDEIERELSSHHK